MLNNEFRFIGTVLTDYTPVGSESYVKYEIKVEVEKKTKGKAATYPIVVLGTNKTVDFTNTLKGKRVILNGYIDIYKERLSLVLQDFEIIGETSEPTEPTTPLQDIPAETKNEEPEAIDLPDDDLPF